MGSLVVRHHVVFLQMFGVAHGTILTDFGSAGYGVFPTSLCANIPITPAETSCCIAASYEAKAFGVAQRGAGDRLNQ